jgi:hypothetical protein
LDKENYVQIRKINNFVKLEFVNNKNLFQTGGIRQKQNAYVKFSIVHIPFMLFFKFCNP